MNLNLKEICSNSIIHSLIDFLNKSSLFICYIFSLYFTSPTSSWLFLSLSSWWTESSSSKLFLTENSAIYNEMTRVRKSEFPSPCPHGCIQYGMTQWTLPPLRLTFCHVIDFFHNWILSISNMHHMYNEHMLMV